MSRALRIFAGSSVQSDIFKENDTWEFSFRYPGGGVVLPGYECFVSITDIFIENGVQTEQGIYALSLDLVRPDDFMYVYIISYVRYQKYILCFQISVWQCSSDCNFHS